MKVKPRQSNRWKSVTGIISRKLKKALMAEPEAGQMVFGKKIQKAEPSNTTNAEEEKPEEAYKRAYQSLSKAVKAFSGAVDKLHLLKTSLENKQEQQPNAQLAASVDEMKKLEKAQ